MRMLVRTWLQGEKDAAATEQEQPEGPRPPAHVQRKLTRKVKFLERELATRMCQPSKSPHASSGWWPSLVNRWCFSPTCAPSLAPAGVAATKLSSKGGVAKASASIDTTLTAAHECGVEF
jgi:hypothetical protein